MVQYGDAHRLFLQVFVAKNILTETDCHSVYLKVGQRMEVDTPADGLTAFIRAVNLKLSALAMEIRMGRAEATGEKYYALVNTQEDEASKLATDFAAHEIEFIKKVLETLILSPDGCSSSTELINLGHDLQKKLSGAVCQELLKKMHSRKWLDYTHGEYMFGPRALIELGQYMEGKFKDHVSVCDMCHTVVVMGDACLDCGKKIHKYCAATRFSGLPQEKRKCPSCSALWDQELISLPKQTAQAVDKAPVDKAVPSKGSNRRSSSRR